MGEKVASENDINRGRRALINRIGIFGLVAAGFTWIGSTVRFLYPQVFYNPPSKVRFDLQSILGKTKGGTIDENGIILVDDSFLKLHKFFIVVSIDKLYALSARCTHLGCTVNWVGSQHTFKCPCHGSQYTSVGKNFAGPAPKPLEVLKITKISSNIVEIDTRIRADLFENTTGYALNI